jgi:hypothetical protein
VHHMDVKSSFLNGEMAEKVYIRQPPVFIVDGEEDKVLHLDKELYELRQAPHAWNEKLDKTLAGLGFSHIAFEHVVYAHSEGASQLLWVFTWMISSSLGTTQLRLQPSRSR